MKRLITLTFVAIATAAFAAPTFALEGRHAEEFHDGLGNKLSDRTEQEFYSGLGNKGTESSPDFIGRQFEG